MTLAEELQWRGQIKDKTFADLTWLNTPRTFYLGSDPSSDSLTIGNLAIYMLARRLRKHGWKAVMLVGGATSLIGDPGGKEEERELKSREELQTNVKGLEKQIEQLFAGLNFTLVDNYDWFKDIGYLEFLREIGKQYSMTELLQRDFIVSRIGEGGSGISYAEFSYSLIQGYDYWHLYKKHKVELQIGGSDQWGNMLSGVPLIRKKENVEVHALSMPLVIDKSTGKKFGKSEGGAVWLDPNKTSIYQFYQFWLNIGDDAVEEYLKIYTELDKPAVQEVMMEFHTNKAGRKAQKTLAYEVTKIVHSQDAADTVQKITQTLFEGGEYAKLSADDLKQLATGLPVVNAQGEANLVGLIVQAGLASSNTEARRFVQDGGIYINGEQLDPSSTTLSKNNSLHGYVILRRGKNNQALVRLT
jgi:tyrosyl-tRNA synthetase